MAQEPEGDQETEDRRTYRWNLAAAIILSAATLASAWCGFQASVWNSVYSAESRTANVARLEAARQSAVADRQQSTDVLLFTTWFEAEVNGQQQLADEVVLRFQVHFVPAFEAWRALPAGRDGHLPDGSPFERPEYTLPSQAAIDNAYTRATAAITTADAAGATATRYVLSTVLFASVLFLAGIADKLTNKRVAHAVVVVAGVTLIGAVTTLATLPVSLAGT